MSATMDRNIPDDADDDIAPLPARAGGDERPAARQDTVAPSPFVNAPGQGPKGEDVQFDIIETDDDGKPLAGQSQRREGGLSTDETDEGTLLERRQRDDQTARHAEERRHMSPEQRREADRRQKEYRKRARDRNINENAELKAQVERLERQLSGVVPRIAAHDRARVQDTLTQYTQGIEAQDAIAAGARQRMAQAMTDQDGDALAAALEMRDNAIAEKTRISGAKAALEARVAEADRAGDSDGQPGDDNRRASDDRRAPARPPQLSAQATDRMEDFFERHSWIDRTDARDPITQAVLKIDALVASEGLRPESQEYWDTIEDMMAANPRLRPLMDDARDAQPAPRNGRAAAAPIRRGPAVGGGSERSPGAPPARPGAVQVHLSPGRKQALIAAGILGSDGKTVQNHEKFQRTMKSYADYDASNGQQG